MIAPQTGPIISIIQSRNVTVSGGRYQVDSTVFVRVDGEQSGAIRLIGVDLKRARKAVELGPNVKADAVRQE